MPLFSTPSSAQGLYARSTKPWPMPKPSPAQEDWLLLFALRPSMEAEEYERPMPGFRSPGTGGTPMS